MNRSQVFRRVGAVSATGVALILGAAPVANATWSSYIENWGIGSKSRTWSDESYTQTHFTKCSTSYSSSSVDVRLYRYRQNDEPIAYDIKHFTQCMYWSDGDDTSTGVWTGLPAGSYYFQIKGIDGFGSGSEPRLAVREVIQDTTLAD